MKKILLMTVALLLLIPVTNTFAFTDGYFDKRQDYTLSGNIVNPQRLFDNIASTDAAAIGANSTALITLADPVDLEKVDLKLQNSSTQLVHFLAADMSIIRTFSGSEVFAADGVVQVDLQAVKFIRLQNTSQYNYGFREIEIYEKTATTITTNPVTALTETHNYNSVTLDWTNPTGTAFVSTKILQNGVEVANVAKTASSHTISSLDPETVYTFNVIAVYEDGTESVAETVTVTTEPMPADTEPPPNITSVTHVKTDTIISFLYSLPVDTDFSHIKIYRDGELIEPFFTASSFDDFGLIGNTLYTYKFVSVDINGNESNGYIQSITTDISVDGTAPDLPMNITVTPGGSSAAITWDASTSTDVAGYNVYVNGIRHNESPILGTYYVLNNLTNDTTYNVTMSAVDTSDNESVLSAAYPVTPASTIMPIFEMNYSLQDVADGTANWFGSLWLLLAFSVAIPLAFLVARRIKGLLIS